MNDIGIGRVQLNRTIVQLEVLYNNLSAQDFGRLMQGFLACVFEHAGFQVTENAVGVPDFTASPIATPAIDSGTIAVEVKTSDRREVTLSERELTATKMAGQLSILAALDYPSRTPKWALVSAHHLSPGKWPMRRLLAKPQVDVGFGLQDSFHLIVGGLDASSVRGGPALDEWTASKRREFLRP